MPGTVNIIIEQADYGEDTFAKLGALFKTDAETMRARLAKADVVAKRGVDSAQGEKLVEMIQQKTGARVRLETAQAPGVEPHPAEPAPAPAPSTPPPAASEPTAAQRTPLIIGAVAALVLCIMMGGYYYWTTTPSYSLNQVRTAIDTNDLVLFEKHVDVETFTERMVDAVMAWGMGDALSEAEASGDEWEQMGAQVGAGLVAMMKPKLTQELEKQITRWVETGDPIASDDKIDVNNMKSELGIENLDRANLDIAVDGKVATVTAEVHREDLNLTQPLTIAMRDRGGYWQVVEWTNAAEALETIENAEQARLAAANERIGDELLAIAPDFTYEDRVDGASRWRRGTLVAESVHPIQGDRAITGLSGSLVIYDVESGEDLASSAFDYQGEAVAPGQALAITSHFKMDFQNGDLVKAIDAGRELDYGVYIERAVFADGTELALLDKYGDLRATQ